MWSGDNWGRKVDREWDKIRQGLTEKVTPEQRPGRSEKIVFRKEELQAEGGAKVQRPRGPKSGDAARRPCAETIVSEGGHAGVRRPL